MLKVGDMFRLNPETNKSDWSLQNIGGRYKTIYKIKTISRYDYLILTEHDKDTHWQVSEAFLKEHFIPYMHSWRDRLQ